MRGLRWLNSVPGGAGPAAADDDHGQVQPGQVTVVAASGREIAALAAADALQLQGSRGISRKYMIKL